MSPVFYIVNPLVVIKNDIVVIIKINAPLVRGVAEQRVVSILREYLP
jgi:hypothetical protein